MTRSRGPGRRPAGEPFPSAGQWQKPGRRWTEGGQVCVFGCDATARRGGGARCHGLADTSEGKRQGVRSNGGRAAVMEQAVKIRAISVFGRGSCAHAQALRYISGTALYVDRGRLAAALFTVHFSLSACSASHCSRHNVFALVAAHTPFCTAGRSGAFCADTI